MDQKEVPIKIESNLESVNRIITSLAELPYKLVANDIESIRAQAQKQLESFQKKQEKSNEFKD